VAVVARPLSQGGALAAEQGAARRSWTRFDLCGRLLTRARKNNWEGETNRVLCHSDNLGKYLNSTTSRYVLSYKRDT
jgi:hypothetical protein